MKKYRLFGAYLNQHGQMIGGDWEPYERTFTLEDFDWECVIDIHIDYYNECKDIVPNLIEPEIEAQDETYLLLKVGEHQNGDWNGFVIEDLSTKVYVEYELIEIEE